MHERRLGLLRGEGCRKKAPSLIMGRLSMGGVAVLVGFGRSLKFPYGFLVLACFQRRAYGRGIWLFSVVVGSVPSVSVVSRWLSHVSSRSGG